MSTMELKTDRLRLRPLTLDDLDVYAVIIADPDVQTWLNGGVPRDGNYAGDYLRRLDKSWKEKGFTRFGVFRRQRAELIGHCGPMDNEGIIDMGWTLARQAWGQGFCSEAAAAVVSWFFDAGHGDYVTAKAFSGNQASIGVMQKIGMTWDHQTVFSHPDYPAYEGETMEHYAITLQDHLSRR